MKLSVKYSILLTGLTKCPHEWDCCSLRANSALCSTCRVLFSIVRLHFACRLEWSLYNLARVDDYVHLLPTSDLFRHFFNDKYDEDDVKTYHSLELTIWSLWTPSDHPIVQNLHDSTRDAFPLQVKIERSKPLYHLWYRKGTLVLNRWLHNSLAKQPGAIYSQLPDARVADLPETPLPTRVLDLMPDGLIQQVGNSPDAPWSPFIRIAVTQPGTTGRYLTLSHRWGPSQSLRLTTANLDQLKEGIFLRYLPKTFREAAMIATELGYRYLWIDALCIIQDDPQDWLEESAKMCTVYRNSSCTIASHTSLDSNYGFLDALPTKTALQSKINNILKNAPLSTSPRQTQEYSVLNTRGWVFQERILSRRILHFLEDKKVFFEDASGISTDETKGIYDPQRRFLPFKYIDHPLIHDAKPNLEDVIEKSTQWYRLVERYSRCDLTYDSDRLPAVAGLARYYQELNQSQSGTYLFGLWLSSIHQGLLWIETSHQTPTKISASQDGSVPQPPSWSWGLWKSPIRYPYHLAACTPVASTGDNQGDVTVFDRPAELPNTFNYDTTSNTQLHTHLNHASQQPSLPHPPVNKVLTLKLPIVSFPPGISARRKARGLTNCPSFPKQAMDNLYDIINLPSDTIRPNWVAFDGRRENVIRFETELTIVLVAANVKVEYFFWVEDEDNTQHRSEEYLYYFLVLERVNIRDCENDNLSNDGGAGGDRKRYRRVGVGAVRRTSWWSEEAGGRVEVVEIE